MKIASDRIGQQLPKRLAGRAEGDSADEGAVSAAQLYPHMPAAADLARFDDTVIGEDEDRLRLRRAERPCPLERLHNAGLGAPRGQRGVDGEMILQKRIGRPGSASLER